MTLGKKMRDKRNHLGFSLADIAGKSGISATYIMNIEKGHLPKDQVLIKLIKVLGLDLKTALKQAEYERDPEAYSIKYESEDFTINHTALPIETMIPLMKYSKAAKWREIIDDDKPEIGLKEIFYYSNTPDVFGLLINDEKMKPVFQKGHIAIVDPHRRPIDGDLVVIANQKNSTIKRYYLIDEGTIMFEPLNPAFEKTEFETADSKKKDIIGVIIEIKLH